MNRKLDSLADAVVANTGLTAWTQERGSIKSLDQLRSTYGIGFANNFCHV